MATKKKSVKKKTTKKKKVTKKPTASKVVKQIEKEIIPTEAELEFDDVELEEEFGEEATTYEEYIEDMGTVDSLEVAE